jgi:putative ABC transport system permease protein
MIIKANLKEAIISLLSSKQRTFLALLGIVIGIGSVIAMISVGKFVQNEALSQFEDMGTDIIQLRVRDSQLSRQKKPKNISFKDIRELPEQCPDISSFAPFISVFGALKIKGKAKNIQALGVTESFYDVFKLTLNEGRFISDLDNRMHFCVLSEKIADSLKESGINKLVGTRILFMNQFYTILGVVEKVPMGNMRPYEINEGILLPVNTVSRLPNNHGINEITLRMHPMGNNIKAIEQLTNFFKAKFPKRQTRITSAEELINNMRKQQQMFSLLLAAIGSISLVVGGIGVMNVMLVAVSERKKEIGIRRALGATKMDIQFQFLIESIILCFIGGIIGIGIGIGGSYFIAKNFEWQFSISWTAILIGFFVSTIIGIFFGFFPARQASKLHPIEALRA